MNLLAEIGENVVVILSTHIVEDVADLCPRMAVIVAGQVQLEGAPDDLIAASKGSIWEKTISRTQMSDYAEKFNIISSRLQAGRSVIHIKADSDPDQVLSRLTVGWRTSTSPHSRRREQRHRVRQSTTRDIVMFGSIFRFELFYQLRNPVFIVTALIFFLLTFGAVTLEDIQIGSGGNIHVNSPYAIAQTVLIMSLFYMFATTAFVANVVVRDDESGFGPMVRSTRVSKFDYLLGRFTGAFVAALAGFPRCP